MRISYSLLLGILFFSGCRFAALGRAAHCSPDTGGVGGFCAPLENRISYENFTDEQSGSCDWNRPAIWSSTSGEPYTSADYRPATLAEPYGVPGSGVTPLGSRCALHYFYKAGRNDQTPAQLPFVGEINELHVCWYEYFASPFTWPAGQKLARFYTNSGLGGMLQFQWNTAVDGSQGYTFFLHDAGGPGKLFGGTFRAARLSLDTWHQFCIYVRESSAGGVADGELALWYNGWLLRHGRNVVTTSAGQPSMAGFWIGGNNTWNGSGPGRLTAIPQNQSRYIADIEISRRPPGFKSGNSKRSPADAAQLSKQPSAMTVK